MQTEKVIDGRIIAQKITDQLNTKFLSAYNQGYRKAGLAIILVGDDPASQLYINRKIHIAEQIGIQVNYQRFAADASEDAILALIQQLNTDDTIDGIIVQLPLPMHIKPAQIAAAIEPSKDVDGLHPSNIGKLYSNNDNGFVPCTALGCLELIHSKIKDLTGKQAVVIGRSMIVGRPVAALLLKANCTVTICHSYTKNLETITREAEIIVSAIGKPQILTAKYFNPNAIVIDVGINRHNNHLVGDVDFINVIEKVRYLTPVPGGVGPMTIAYLMQNTYKAYCQNLIYPATSDLS